VLAQVFLGMDLSQAASSEVAWFLLPSEGVAPCAFP
jgi:hypothetical protein